MPSSKAAATEAEVNFELEAMQTIARTLIWLRDAQTRDRVPRWTIERFNAVPAVTAAMPAASQSVKAPSALACDPALTVDARDFFPEALELAVPSLAASAAEPLDSLMRGVASDFRTLALQWQRA